MSHEFVNSLVSVLSALIRGEQIRVEAPDTVLTFVDAASQRGVLIAKLAVGFDQRRDGPLEPIEIEAVGGCLVFRGCFGNEGTPPSCSDRTECSRKTSSES